MNEYLEMPWSIEDTIENLKENKEYMQKKVLSINLHGKGEKDAKEIAFDFDRAIEALEKQIAKEPYYSGDGYWNGELVYDTWTCPNCSKSYEVDYDDYDFCPNCGQKIKWNK